MIKISILYPNTPNSRFDLQYYIETHVPMAIECFETHPGFKGVSVERGLAGEPDKKPIYIATCHFQFDSVEDFMTAFIPNRARLEGDMPNYTDIDPVIQFNEVLICQSF
jgi:uncharacterized protein (TIGR02118 family)